MKRETIFGTVFAVLAVFIVLLLCLYATTARGDQPECTGDRHYDGVACCPVVDPPSSTTTSTTLPGDPSTPTCPTVMCVCDSAGGAMTGVVNVTVNKCPDVVFPNYIPCKRKHGKIVCPKPNYHGRVISPLPLL